MKERFLLDPGVVFLNHGSFGAVPTEVLEYRQSLERSLQEQPVRFLQRRLFDLLEEARTSLGAYLNADPGALALVPNATMAVNIVARSIRLEAGDEILITNHEYGACANIFSFLCSRKGALLIRKDVPLPIRSPGEAAEAIWSGVTEHTRLIFLSHLTSPTAVQLPVEEVVRRARAAGIPVMVDGAHAPGQVPLDLKALDPDYYTGNCHKWMLSPLGSAFLYTRGELQDQIEPLVVSWGWSGELGLTSGSRYLDNLQWWGTYDPTPALTIPRAIRFMEENCWEAVAAGCRDILGEALRRLEAGLGVQAVSPPSGPPAQQMAAVDLSPVKDIASLKERLYDRHWVEVPCFAWEARPLMRISIQAYNNLHDVDVLLEGLEECLEHDRWVP